MRRLFFSERCFFQSVAKCDAFSRVLPSACDVFSQSVAKCEVSLSPRFGACALPSLGSLRPLPRAKLASWTPRLFAGVGVKKSEISRFSLIFRWVKKSDFPYFSSGKKIRDFVTFLYFLLGGGGKQNPRFRDFP